MGMVPSASTRLLRDRISDSRARRDTGIDSPVSAAARRNDDNDDDDDDADDLIA